LLLHLLLLYSSLVVSWSVLLRHICESQNHYYFVAHH
jgi:hypothetical protein